MKELIKYFIFYIKFTRWRFLVFVICSFFAMGCEALFIVSMLPILEWGQSKPGHFSAMIYSFLSRFHIAEKNSILFCLLLFAFLCILFATIGTLITKLYVASLQGELFHKFEMEVASKIYNGSYEYVISKNSGYLNNALMQHVPNTAVGFKVLAILISSSILTGVYLLVPVIKSPIEITLLFILLSPAIIIVRIFNKKNKDYSIENARKNGEFNGLLLQSIGNFKYLKSTGMIRFILKKIDKEVRELGCLMKKNAIWGDTSHDFIKPYAMLAIFAMLYYAVTYQGKPFIEAGAMFGLLYMAYQKSVLIPIAYQRFTGLIGSIEVYQNILDEVKDSPDPYKIEGVVQGVPPDFSQDLFIKDLTFRYLKAKDPVLKDISMRVAPKQSIALVGESGSGKSTLVNVIAALFKPEEGELFMGETPYSKMDIQTLRSNIGYVTQEPVVFNDTVWNNITLWDPNADMEKVMEAAKKAHADRFIEELSDKYDTLLGENGVNLSGGQRQRLTIARELFREPRIFIFDEATSALDSETEKNIQKEIDEMKGERTMIIIAHRLSTIINCDVIYVLDKGRIVEHGSYNELLNKQGRFAEMVNKQRI